MTTPTMISSPHTTMPLPQQALRNQRAVAAGIR